MEKLRKAKKLLFQNDGGRATVEWYCGGQRCLLSIVKHRGRFYKIIYDMSVRTIYELAEINEEEAKRTLANWSSSWYKGVLVWGWKEEERLEYACLGVGG